MDEAFVKHTQHDVYGDEGGENEQAFVGKGILERGRGSLKFGLQADGKMNLANNVIDIADGSAQGDIRSQVERHSHRRKLSLVIDRESLRGICHANEGTERDSISRRGGDGGIRRKPCVSASIK